MDKRVIILFGAGASNGCGGVEKPPPMGRNLFSSLAKKYRDTWGKIPNKYAMRFTPDFENGMGALYDDNPDVADILKDMTRYFSGFTIKKPEENLYFKLVARYHKQLLSTELTFATINYDCLIEWAIMMLHPPIPITYWGEGSGIRLHKIHGSCNFIKTKFTGKGKVRLNRGVVEGRLKVVHPLKVEEEMNNTPLPAAMSLYVKNKDILISPSIIKEIIRTFQNNIQKSHLIVVIGVNPNIDDKHIWDFISETKGMVALIGNEKKCKDWLANNRSSENGKWIGNRFETSFADVISMLDKSFR